MGQGGGRREERKISHEEVWDREERKISHEGLGEEAKSWKER